VGYYRKQSQSSKVILYRIKRELNGNDLALYRLEINEGQGWKMTVNRENLQIGSGNRAKQPPPTGPTPDLTLYRL